MQFDISYDFKQPVKFLSALEKRLSRKRDLLDWIGKHVANNVAAYIWLGRTPEGAIEPTSEWVARLEGKGHQKPLRWSDALMNSIKRVFEGDAVLVGSALPYAEKVRVGGKRQFRRRVINVMGEERWIKGGIVYEDGIRRGKGGVVETGTGPQKGYWPSYDIDTPERNYLVVTQQDADDLMEYLWRGVTGED